MHHFYYIFALKIQVFVTFKGEHIVTRGSGIQIKMVHDIYGHVARNVDWYGMHTGF